MKRVIIKLYEAISYRRIDDFLGYEKDRDFAILLNQYIFLLSIIFLLQCIFSTIFFGFSTDAIVLFAISICFLLSFLLPMKIVKNQYFILCVFIILTSIVTYYSSLCGFASGIFLFYFPLISAVYIFFSWNTHRHFIIFLLLLILSNLYVSAGTNFKLVENDTRYIEFRHTLLLLNISCMLSILTLNSYCFLLKREEYYFTLNRNLYKREKIESLSNEVQRLKKVLNKDVFSEETLKDLIDSIHLNDVIFIEKFEVFFPEFVEKLHKISSTPLSISDVKMCAMLKLGFTAKQIAIYTSSTIKSVDGKIYRVRKKLNLSPNTESKSWFTSL